MRRPGLNLARRPFANSRPVIRLALVLWLLGALFFGGNLWLYWDFLSGRGTANTRLAEVDQGLVAADHHISQWTAELAGFDLATQNDEVRYLNARIEERLFSWSRLFDQLAQLLPADARLLSLAPVRADRRQAKEASTTEKFVLQIEGQAKSGEALLEFVDRLYDDSAFDRPNLASENEDATGLVGFQLTVPYDPAAREPAEPAEPMKLEPPSRPASSSLELEK